MAAGALSLNFVKCRAASALFLKRSFGNTTRLLIDEHSKPQEDIDTIHINESCVARLQELGEGTSLRVGVDGGGCSGFQYTFELDTPIEKGDFVLRKGGVTVLIDETSLQYLRGATIEYHTELIRSAFRVVNNPLAEQGCSCGSSFNIKFTKE